MEKSSKYSTFVLKLLSKMFTPVSEKLLSGAPQLVLPPPAYNVTSPETRVTVICAQVFRGIEGKKPAGQTVPPLVV